MFITNYNSFRSHVFGEYLTSDWRFFLAAGIDFTASNGYLKDPSSLHYIGTERPDEHNLYILLLKSVIGHI